MPPLAQNLPVQRVDDTLEILDHSVTLKRFDLLVWVSITPEGQRPDRDSKGFPALLDTGHSHNLSIDIEHLERWHKLTLSELDYGGRVNVRYADGFDEERETWEADLWMHSNIPGLRPLRVRLSGGIVVYERTTSGAEPRPRLPVLGAKALHAAKLQVIIDYRNLRFSLFTR